MGTSPSSVDEDGAVVLSVTTDGQVQTVRLGAFNAWRAFGLLACVLGIPLPARLTRVIKLS